MRPIYIGMLLAATALAAGCQRTDPEEKAFSSEYIRFTADVPQTKGFLNQDGIISPEGTRFKVYDYLSGYTGTISGHSDGEEFAYIDSNISYDADAPSWKWVFDGDAAYRWTHTGTHRFLGYLAADANDPTRLNTSAFFSSPSLAADNTLSLTKSLTFNTPQYDFLYSDITTVDVEEDIPETVPLPMKHLFSALGISVANFSEAAVDVLSVTLPEFPAKNSVKLDWGDLTASVAVRSPSGGAYPDPVYDSSAPFMTAGQFPSAGVTLPAQSGNSVEYDAFTGTQVTTSNPLSFKMVWPASISRLRPETPYTGPQTGANEGREYMATDSLIVVRYRVNSIESTVRIKFPATFDDPDGNGMFLRAGTKTHLQLQFLDKQILLKYTVLPWQYEAIPMSFEGDAISSTQLKFTEGTYSDGGKVRDATGNHQVIELIQGSSAGNYVATGTFYIYTPVNATLTVGLGGNAEDFTVQLNGGNESTTINPERNGGRIDFKIMPNGTPQRGAQVSLHFSVRNNGRDSDADTEINRDHYYVVIP